MGPSAARAWLEFPSREFYTDGDVIKGTAHIDTLRELTVTEVVVKLRCFERAVVSSGEIDRHLNLHGNYFDKVLFEDTWHIWPTTQLSEAIPYATKRTLRSGHHEFPFSVQIPWDLAPELPGSLPQVQQEKEARGVLWVLRLSVRRPELLKSNVRWGTTLTVLPWVALPDLSIKVRFRSQSNLALVSKTPPSTLTKRIQRMVKSPVVDASDITSIIADMTIPAAGIPQSPLPLHIELSLWSVQQPRELTLTTVTVQINEQVVSVVGSMFNVYETTVFEKSVSINKPISSVPLHLADEFRDFRVSGLSQRYLGEFITYNHQLRVLAQLVLSGSIHPKPVSVVVATDDPRILSQAASQGINSAADIDAAPPPYIREE